MRFIYFVIISFFIFSCEPLVKIKTAGKMLSHEGVFSVYNGKIKSNNIYTVTVKDKTVYIGTDKGLHISYDDCKTFAVVDIPKANGTEYFNNIEVNVTRFCVKDIASYYRVYMATNKGLYYKDSNSETINFIDIDSLGNSLQLFTVFIDSKNNIFVGTYEHGLYVSPDNGVTWINHIGTDIKKYNGLDNLSYKDYVKKATDPVSGSAFVEEVGVIKVEPFYTGKMKSKSVTAIYEYEGYLYCGTMNGGLSYTKIPQVYSNAWTPYWKTYTQSWYFFDAASEEDYKWNIWSNRNYESDWTIRNNYITNIDCNKAGIFVSTRSGLAFTSHGEKYGDKDVMINAPYLDNFGRRQYVFDNKNQYVQNISKGVDGNNYGYDDRDNWDTYDDVYNITQGNKEKYYPPVRIWEEYCNYGIDVAKFEDSKTIQVIDDDNPLLTLKLESNTINDVKLGTINSDDKGNKNYIIYAGTASGLAIAELRTRVDRAGEVYVTTKVKDNWISYHNIVDALEKTVVNQIFITKKDNGDDDVIYVATASNGLLKFSWPK